MKHLVGKDVSKEVSFMGDKVTITKLSAGRIMEVQELVKKNAKKDADPMDLVRGVLVLGVTGAADLAPEDFLTFPLDEMNDLVDAVLRYSGLKADNEAADEGN